MMNKITKSMLMLTTATMAVGCADTDIDLLEVEKPASIAKMEYLNEYDALKSYIDRSKNPNFKLGAAIEADAFNKGGLESRIVSSNFDEMTAGNAMKYASVVKDNGTMDFDGVRTFVNNAKAAGLTVYGHTLAWHSQQNIKYLTKLMADKELPNGGEAEIVTVDEINYENLTEWPYDFHDPKPNESCYVKVEDGMLVADNEIELTNPWDFQYPILDNLHTVKGKEYTLSITLKAEKAGGIQSIAVGQYPDNTMCGNYGEAVTEEWQTKTFKFTAAMDGGYVNFQSGNEINRKIYIKEVKITEERAAAVDIFTSKGGIDYATFEDQDFPHHPMGVKPRVEGGSLNYIPSGEWDQFFCLTGFAMTPGNYVIDLDIEADEAISGVALAAQNGWSNQQSLSANVSIEAGRNIVRVSMSDITCALTNGETADKYDFIMKPQTCGKPFKLHSVDVILVTKGNTIPLTPEEKKDTLTWAMDQWIAGMMEATDGYVTTWDVVNEAIGGDGNDGEGNYALQHADNPDDNGVKGDAFYWQDVMGDIDYVRTAVASARKHFKGDAKDLKLFINDYNLESWWDDNKKAQSLVNWIAKWEADGVTKIDGIGTQMHISCWEDDKELENQKKSIVNMFKILASSGKLIKISELDMGYCDKAFASAWATANVNEAQQKKMADFYKFVINAYFENVPAAQRYGITQWCLTDASGELGTGWRGGEPVGLWDLQWNRKHTYAGFAEGLKEASSK